MLSRCLSPDTRTGCALSENRLQLSLFGPRTAHFCICRISQNSVEFLLIRNISHSFAFFADLHRTLLHMPNSTKNFKNYFAPATNSTFCSLYMSNKKFCITLGALCKSKIYCSNCVCIKSIKKLRQVHIL